MRDERAEISDFGFGISDSAFCPLPSPSALFSTLAVSLPSERNPPRADSTSYVQGPWRMTLAPVS